MIRRTLAVAGTVALALALLGGAGTAATTAGGKFKPKQYAGKWKGSWFNETFKTTGAATMTLKVKGKGKRQKLKGTFDLGGNAFGCADPDPRTITMKKGKGKNSFNSKGFKVAYNNGQGPVKLSYKQKNQRFSGSGTSPCTPAITYSFDGKMTKKKVTADVEIFNGGMKFATSSLKMNKK